MHSGEIIVLVPLYTTREVVVPLANNPIMSGNQYGHLDTLNTKIHPLFQILWADPGQCNNSEPKQRSWNGGV